MFEKLSLPSKTTSHSSRAANCGGRKGYSFTTVVTYWSEVAGRVLRPQTLWRTQLVSPEQEDSASLSGASDFYIHSPPITPLSHFLIQSYRNT